MNGLSEILRHLGSHQCGGLTNSPPQSGSHTRGWGGPCPGSIHLTLFRGCDTHIPLQRRGRQVGPFSPLGPGASRAERRAGTR
jgi:hypothetical protein